MTLHRMPALAGAALVALSIAPATAATVTAFSEAEGFFGPADGIAPPQGVTFGYAVAPDGVSEKTCTNCHDAVTFPNAFVNGAMNLTGRSQALVGPGDGSATAATGLSATATVTNTNLTGEPLEVFLDWYISFFTITDRMDALNEEASGIAEASLVRHGPNGPETLAEGSVSGGGDGAYGEEQGFVFRPGGFSVMLAPGASEAFDLSVFSSASALRSTDAGGQPPTVPPTEPPTHVIPLPAAGWLLLGALAGLAALRRRQPGVGRGA